MKSLNRKPLIAEERPQDELNRLWSICEGLPGLVYQFRFGPDGKGMFTFISSSIAKMLGVQPAELYADASIGFALMHPDDLKMAAKGKSLEEDTMAQRSFIFRIKDKNSGLYKWLRGNSVTEKQADGSIVCNGLLIDVTSDKATEEERIAMAQEVNRELESFNYTVSHDLQSPLRSILGFSQIMLTEHNNELSSEVKDYLKIIDINARRMSDLTKNLLSFSRLGKAAVNCRDVNMDLMVKGVIDELLPASEMREMEIIRHKLMPAKCDTGLIKQVWINLLGNAFKYSSKKKMPVIEIGMVEGNSELTYYIKDNGAGFDMQYADRLFAPFQRIHSSEEFDGSGIGLATVHRIITKHGGRVWAEATPGDGACFYFSLPAIKAEIN